MSEQRVTVGIVGMLFFPVGKFGSTSHQALEDKLSEMNSKLRITYDGDMIVYIASDVPDYEAGLTLCGDESMFEAFHNELVAAGLAVLKNKQRMFVDNWYDGSDPPHLMLTLEKAGFRK